MLKYKYIVVIIVLILTSAVSAQEMQISGSVGTSQQSMSLDIRDRSFQADFINLELAVTASVGRYYITVNRSNSVKDDAQTDGNGLLFYGREETAINVGANVWRRLSLFGGYRNGKTPAVYFDPANSGGGEFSITSKGLFAGASYGFKLGNGNLGVNIAVASLQGTVSLFEPFVERAKFVNNPNLTSVPDKVVGDAIGFSYGMAWQAQLGESSNYAVGLKLHRYNFEDSELVGGVDLSFQENYDIFFVTVVNHF